jgi:hypothetical protein
VSEREEAGEELKANGKFTSRERPVFVIFIGNGHVEERILKRLPERHSGYGMNSHRDDATNCILETGQERAENPDSRISRTSVFSTLSCLLHARRERVLLLPIGRPETHCRATLVSK